MDRLWSRDEPTSIRELVDELQQERETAHTTVQDRDGQPAPQGLAVPGAERPGVRYRPVASRQEYSARLIREALDAGHDADRSMGDLIPVLECRLIRL